MPTNEIRVAVDIVVFTVRNCELEVLLVKRKNDPYKNQFALPGGFVETDENLEEAAIRELYEETNVKDIFVKKLTAYGDVNRDPRGRIISVAFMALIDWQSFSLESHADAMEAQWLPVSKVKVLAFDHMTILKDSLDELRFELQTSNIASRLLPDRFTLSELQELYESILGRNLDKRNFRKRIKQLGILQPTSEKRKDGAHRPAALYRFKSREHKAIGERVQVLLD